jgi:hypothetical protein
MPFDTSGRTGLEHGTQKYKILLNKCGGILAALGTPCKRACLIAKTPARGRGSCFAAYRAAAAAASATSAAKSVTFFSIPSPTK